MFSDTFKRRHASCPYCKGKPLITIRERSKRIPDVTYIRHETCPYCEKTVEIVMHEYLGEQGQFQRGIHLRKPIEKEDDELKKMQRIIELYQQ
jgi:glutaredoxin